MTQPRVGQPAGASSAIVHDTVRRWFPGDGLGRPTNREWAIADAIVGQHLDRFYPTGTRLVWPHPTWRNRAYLRSQICRFLVRANIVTSEALRRVHQRTRQQLCDNNASRHPRPAIVDHAHGRGADDSYAAPH